MTPFQQLYEGMPPYHGYDNDLELVLTATGPYKLLPKDICTSYLLISMLVGRVVMAIAI